MEQSPIRRCPVENALVVRCGVEYLLLNVARVRRVVESMTIHPSPFAIPGLSGLARFGGDPLTVFSLQFLTSGEPLVGSGRMTVVVVEIGESAPLQRFGLAVDDVLEIVSVDERDFVFGPAVVVSEPIESENRSARFFDLDALDDYGAISRCPGIGRTKEFN